MTEEGSISNTSWEEKCGASMLCSLGQTQGASLVAQRLKRLPPMRETRVRSLGQEDSPGEGNGYPVQYSCLENQWIEEPGYNPRGHKELDLTNTFIFM